MKSDDPKRSARAAQKPFQSADSRLVRHQINVFRVPVAAGVSRNCVASNQNKLDAQLSGRLEYCVKVLQASSFNFLFAHVRTKSVRIFEATA